MKKLTRKVTSFKGWTMGLDVHKQFIEYCVLNDKGDEALNGRISSSQKDLELLLENVKKKTSALQVCLEACGCFIWIFDALVEKLGRQPVHVAQASRIHMIANSMEKNDANDAWWLAYLLHEGRLPEAFVAEGDLRDLRIASRELRSWTDLRSDLLRRFKSHFAQAGLKVPKNWHASKKGRQKAEEVIKQVKGERKQALNALFKQIGKLSRQLRHWRERVQVLSKNLPEVKILSAEMPGFGPIVSGAVVAELGPPKRFYGEKAYAKATGLTPGYRESGGQHTQTGITRQGSRHARWAFTRAVISCLRCKSGDGLQIRQWVQERIKYKPKKKVIVAAARKLAEGVWRLFALGEVFNLTKAFPVKRAA